MDVFDCEAMHTSLFIKISGEEYSLARSAAMDCFERVRYIENLLSLFVFGSDIDMINTSRIGEAVKVTGTTMDCLTDAFAVSSMSRGTVDISMGEFFLKAKGLAPEGFTPRKGEFEIDPENFFVRKTSSGIIDLGAVGKGFAVDEMSNILKRQWNIKNAFISFGNSSIGAFGKPGKPGEPGDWEISIGDGERKIKIPAEGMSVGASGTSVLGNHIIDPRTGNIPQDPPFRAWSFGKNAAICDGLSTAFMLLSEEETASVCEENGVMAAIQKKPSSPIEYFGDWSNVPH